jgi:hypothetical protein
VIMSFIIYMGLGESQAFGPPGEKPSSLKLWTLSFN